MKKFTSLLLLSIAISGFAKTEKPARPSIPDGEIAGYGYVDLGLPSGNLWATCNIGAENQYEPGEYFAWGETDPRDLFSWKNYEFLKDVNIDADGQPTYSITDIGAQISGTEYDAARAQWGDAWRMPAKEDYEELLEHCTTEYAVYSSIPPRQGLRICGPNGKSILIPPTFSPRDFDIALIRGCEYWTSTANTPAEEDTNPTAMMMRVAYEGSEIELVSSRRHEGFAIRPVISGKDATAVNAITEAVPAMTFTDGKITISGHADDCQLTITDLTGGKISTSSADDNVSLSSLPKGIYLATLSKDGKAISTLKIAVK